MAETSKEYGYNSTFPTRMRKLMAENKTTQKEISLVCDVKSQSVSLWVNGETRPDILSLVKIAEHFNVSTDYLLGLTDVKTTDKATLEACKALGLSEDTVKILMGDVSAPNCYVNGETCAAVFDRLVNEWKEDASFQSQRGYDPESSHPLVKLLSDFYGCLNATSFSIVRTGKENIHISRWSHLLLTANADGAVNTPYMTPRNIAIDSVINRITYRLRTLEHESDVQERRRVFRRNDET